MLRKLCRDAYDFFFRRKKNPYPSYINTGYVYAPYVPLQVTPAIINPSDFKPRKGIMTRYGKKLIQTSYYGTVTVSGKKTK